MAKTKMVDLWLKKAARDLRFSKAALTLDEQFFDEIVFHCQQSVEKSIKAFLTFHKEPFGKTHDIGELLLSVAKIDAGLAQLLESSKILSKYAVAIRNTSRQMRLNLVFPQQDLLDQGCERPVVGLFWKFLECFQHSLCCCCTSSRLRSLQHGS